MTRETLQAIDAALAERALVYGSLPPEGRDLDLLVPASTRRGLEAGLAAAGFHARGGVWARFAAGGADVVDLADAESWKLPRRELEELFSDAVPLDGLEHLARPSAHHRILILARRGRLDRARTEPPEAWNAAADRAAAWGVSLAEADPAPARTARGALRRLRVLARGGLVVTLSGLDGAGKSSQATALAEALRAAGVDAAVEWMPFGQNRTVEAASALARRLIALARRLGKGAAVHEHVSAGGSLLATPGAPKQRTPRERGLLQAWTTVVALANAFHQRRVVTRHALQGRLVIFDRYTLDSVVRLRYLYGDRERFPVQAALIRLLSPRPVQSFLLEVRPEAALARKQDQWSLADLTRQAELYREEAVRLGVPILDGERPRGDLSAEIAQRVWQALP